MSNAKHNSWPCLACLLKAWPLLDLQTNIACCSVSISLWFCGWWDGGPPWLCVKWKRFAFLKFLFLLLFSECATGSLFPSCSGLWHHVTHFLSDSEDSMTLQLRCSPSPCSLSLSISLSWCLLVLCDMRWFCLWLARLVHTNTPLVVTPSPCCPIVDVLFRKR